MLSYNELKIGTMFEFEGTPYEVLDYEFLRMQQRKPVAKTRIKNLLTGQVVEKNFHQNEPISEIEVEKVPTTFLYSSRGDFWFCEKGKPANRFKIEEAKIGPSAQYLKPNIEVIAVKLEDGQIISVKTPIKADLVIKETPPGERGNTAQGGTKAATLETGAVIQVPLFVNTGDVVRVNTDTGMYVERMEKAK
ncbi:MAG: elongation factor P [Candidatus Magasanikbacteria bacterium]|nr:elongation factor P [Candidatus Magasanikbacteria bacterium]